ncbi:hypothetical protein B0H13DRAFT_1916743 [Mycena leptocephala]|nr:hypothetical protein B0H13DRAFT_1916743 [Mycena leptocephala]
MALNKFCGNGKHSQALGTNTDINGGRTHLRRAILVVCIAIDPDLLNGSRHTRSVRGTREVKRRQRKGGGMGTHFMSSVILTTYGCSPTARIPQPTPIARACEAAASWRKNKDVVSRTDHLVWEPSRNSGESQMFKITGIRSRRNTRRPFSNFRDDSGLNLKKLLGQDILAWRNETAPKRRLADHPCEKDAEEAKAACKGDSKYSRENDAFAARLPGLCEHDFIASKRRLRERRDPLASSTSRAAHPLDRRRHFALPVKCGGAIQQLGRGG